MVRRGRWRRPRHGHPGARSPSGQRLAANAPKTRRVHDHRTGRLVRNRFPRPPLLLTSHARGTLRGACDRGVDPLAPRRVVCMPSHGGARAATSVDVLAREILPGSRDELAPVHVVRPPTRDIFSKLVEFGRRRLRSRTRRALLLRREGGVHPDTETTEYGARRVTPNHHPAAP